MSVSVIILAAGSSSRMGQSKQLLAWGDETLLSHTITTAIASRANRVYVVLGSTADQHRKAIEHLPVQIITNPEWARGMGSSLKTGLRSALVSDPAAVLVMVCDQPFVTIDHLNNIIEHFSVTKQQIVASKYQDALGVPALFAKTMFEELANIGDEEGARKVIERHKKEVASVHLTSGTDLDTPDDYRKALAD